MKFKIISDSSSNVLTYKDIPYTTVPLKIVTADREYVDDIHLNVAAMINDLQKVKGRTGTSCPNVYEWKTAMEDADEVFVLTITSGLSGSYAAAMQAKTEMEAEHPEKKICVIDTLSTGPEMQLLIEKISELFLAGKSFEQIEQEVRSYQKRTHLLFCLQSLDNLAKNGRVNPMVAKVAGLLGIRMIGIASDEGKLQLLHKSRGAQKAKETILFEMEKAGYCGGNVRLAHCQNETGALQLCEMIQKKYPSADIDIIPTTALCSFYAEVGGLMIGFEG